MEFHIWPADDLLQKNCLSMIKKAKSSNKQRWPKNTQFSNIWFLDECWVLFIIPEKSQTQKVELIVVKFCLEENWSVPSAARPSDASWEHYTTHGMRSMLMVIKQTSEKCFDKWFHHVSLHGWALHRIHLNHRIELHRDVHSWNFVFEIETQSHEWNAQWKFFEKCLAIDNVIY